jgi:chromosome segregation ATPase
MKSLFEKQEKERMKPIQDIQNLSQENAALKEQLQSLNSIATEKVRLQTELELTQAQVAAEKQAREAQESQYKEKVQVLNETQKQLQNSDSQMSAKCREIEGLRTQLSESKAETGKETALRLEVEKKLRKYQEETEAKLQLGIKLFTTHEEILEHHCKNEPASVKATIMKALGDEFGQLKSRV